MSRQIKKVFVAMSGGVDSSVAAALLKKQGYDVTGVFMRPWQPSVSVESRKLKVEKNSEPHSTLYPPHSSFCLWQKDREDAMKVAAKLGIPLLTWDFSKEYKKEVTDYMIREYRAGRTPNPDVMCNHRIKFGVFLTKALSEGADYIATGHYIRIKKITNYALRINESRTIRNSQSAIFKLYKSKDGNKDQSYFLWTLTQEQLKHCLFPIGDYIKPEVRKLAKRFGLPTADKKDSQGVCFIGPLDMKDFLKKYIKPKEGEIRLIRDKGQTKGRQQATSALGRHDGIFYYTIGQRHGLNIGDGGGPYYVVGKDIKKNILVVAKSDKDRGLQGKETELIDVNFVAQRHSNILENVGMSGMKVSMRTRYRQPLVRAKIMFANNQNKNRVRVLFEKPQKAITPGQSAVFYRNGELLGGGVIK